MTITINGTTIDPVELGGWLFGLAAGIEKSSPNAAPRLRLIANTLGNLVQEATADKVHLLRERERSRSEEAKLAASERVARIHIDLFDKVRRERDSLAAAIRMAHDRLGAEQGHDMTREERMALHKHVIDTLHPHIGEDALRRAWSRAEKAEAGYDDARRRVVALERVRDEVCEHRDQLRQQVEQLQAELTIASSDAAGRRKAYDLLATDLTAERERREKAEAAAIYAEGAKVIIKTDINKQIKLAKERDAARTELEEERCNHAVTANALAAARAEVPKANP